MINEKQQPIFLFYLISRARAAVRYAQTRQKTGHDSAYMDWWWRLMNTELVCLLLSVCLTYGSGHQQDLGEALIGHLVIHNVYLPIPPFYKQLSRLRYHASGDPTSSAKFVPFLKLDTTCLPSDHTRVVEHYGHQWWGFYPESLRFESLEEDLSAFHAQVCPVYHGWVNI
jgi:hypothetical protein